MLSKHPRNAPPENLFRNAVRLLLGARDFKGVCALFERIADNQDLLKRMLPLHLEARVRDGDIDGAKSLLQEARRAGKPTPKVEAWSIAIELAEERYEAAIAAMNAYLDAYQNDLGTLAPILRTAKNRTPLADALVLRFGDNIQDERILGFVAWGVWERRGAEETLKWAKKAIAANDQQPQMYMLAARAANRLKRSTEARSFLSAGILHLAPEVGQVGLLRALEDVVYPDLGRMALHRDLVGLGDFSFTRKIRDGLDQADGNMQAIIDRFLSDAEDPDREVDPMDFFYFCGACIETSQYDLMRQEMLRLPEGCKLTALHLERMMCMPSIDEDPETRAFVANRLRALPGRDEDTSSALLVGITASEGRNEFGEFAAKVADYLDQGFPAHDLRLYLAERGEGLIAKVGEEAVAESLRKHAATALDVLIDPTDNSFVRSERHLCEMMHENMLLDTSETPKVTILAPTHRAGDLMNLRDCIARQTWPNLEVVVVANGPLYEDPAVDVAMMGLPNVKVLRMNNRPVGGYLNAAVDLAEGDYLVRFDADDLYFDNYVTTAIRSMQRFGADVAGKAAIFYYSELFNRIFLARHQRYFTFANDGNEFGTGSSLCVRREVFEDIRFNEKVDRGEDSLFYTNAIAKAWQVLNLDPFNHLVIRRASLEAHTWHARDRHLFPGKLYCMGALDKMHLVSTLSAPNPPITLDKLGLAKKH